MSSFSMKLPDLSAAAPTGENLEHHADFVAMERAAERKPETQYGDVITPATPPDWKEVEALATSLLERTRDLRVLVHWRSPGLIGTVRQPSAKCSCRSCICSLRNGRLSTRGWIPRTTTIR